MSDLVKRLRASICNDKCRAMEAALGCECAEAADRIEQLEAALHRISEYDTSGGRGITADIHMKKIARQALQETTMTGFTPCPRTVEAAILAIRSQYPENPETPNEFAYKLALRDAEKAIRALIKETDDE